MSPVTSISLLAFAGAALALPGQHGWGHNHGHAYMHSHSSSSSYGSANATDVAGSTSFGSGTAVPTAYSSGVEASAAGPATVTVSPVPYDVTAAASSDPASSSVAVSADDAATSSSTCCTTDVTVTTTQKTYVTVTSSSSSSSSVEISASTSDDAASHTTYTITKYATTTVTPSTSSAVSTSSSVLSSSSSVYTPSSSSVVAYSSSSSIVLSSSSSVYTPSSSSVETYSSSSSVLTVSSVQAAKAYSTPAAYSSSASTSSSSSSSYSSSSSTSASASASATSYGSGKRGIAYNVTSDANVLVSAASGSQVSWAYNWLSYSDSLDSGVTFLPTLHADETVFTEYWTTEAQDAISAGAEYLFSFNEPDESGLLPSDVATDFMTYMQPLAGSAKLVAPSVTNGGGSSYGVGWLSSFLGNCTSCSIDSVNLHWYASYDDADSAISAFKSYFEDAMTTLDNKAMWITEFQPSGLSEDDLVSFLEGVMPWMDSQDTVLGYAYFEAYDGILVDGDSLSTLGSTYMTYTS